MTFIDTTVVVIVVAVGVIILYKALKEPLDLLFGAIWRGLGYFKDKILGVGDTGGEYYNEIRYG